MSLTFEEVELLARLEIEMNLASEELNQFISRMEEVSTFDVSEKIIDYFLEGVKYGLTVDHSTTTVELEAEILNTHRDLSGSEEKSMIDEIFKEQFSELFSVVFLNGTQWTVQHKLLNGEL